MEDQLHRHQVTGLGNGADLQLFRQAANLHEGLDAAIAEVETEIVAACGGLPLALQLMGGLLAQKKDMGSWKVITTNFADLRLVWLALVAPQCGSSKNPTGFGAANDAVRTPGGSYCQKLGLDNLGGLIR